jgi:hypothetical protein
MSGGNCKKEAGSETQLPQGAVRMWRIRAPGSCRTRWMPASCSPLGVTPRRNLGTFTTRAEAEKQERAVQYFKRAQIGRR